MPFFFFFFFCFPFWGCCCRWPARVARLGVCGRVAAVLLADAGAGVAGALPLRAVVVVVAAAAGHCLQPRRQVVATGGGSARGAARGTARPCHAARTVGASGASSYLVVGDKKNPK